MDLFHWAHFTKKKNPFTYFRLEILWSSSSTIIHPQCYCYIFCTFFRTHFSTYSSFCTPSCPRRRNLSVNGLSSGFVLYVLRLCEEACETLWDMLCYIVLCKGLTWVDFWCIILNVPVVFLPFKPLYLAPSINHRHETVHSRESKRQPCFCMILSLVSKDPSSQNTQFQSLVLLSTNLMKRPQTQQPYLPPNLYVLPTKWSHKCICLYTF